MSRPALQHRWGTMKTAIERVSATVAAQTGVLGPLSSILGRAEVARADDCLDRRKYVVGRVGAEAEALNERKDEQ